MPSKYDGRSGSVWRRNWRILREQSQHANTPCALQLTATCIQRGGQIDYTTTKQAHSFTADHIVPLSLLPAGDRRRNALSNLQPACHACNAAKGNGTRKTPTPRKGRRAL